MQIFEELARDHQKMIGLLSRIGGEADATVRKALWTDLRTLLFAHSKAEEAVFYPILADDESAHLQARAAIEEHERLENLVEEIEKIGFSNDLWRPLFRQLRSGLERHIEEEELDLFRLTRKHVSRSEAEEMGDIFREMKWEVYEELSAI